MRDYAKDCTADCSLSDESSHHFPWLSDKFTSLLLKYGRNPRTIPTRCSFVSTHGVFRIMPDMNQGHNVARAPSASMRRNAQS